MAGAYGGNTLLMGLSTRTGIPLDHLNFVASQILALSLAPLMQTVLHPRNTKPAAREAFVLIIGLFMVHFAFGMQAIHLVILPTLCCVLIRIIDPKRIQRWVMFVALGYLSCIHLHRLFYDTGVYALDVTGPLMVMTQKITSLAFNLHDGLTKKEKEMKPNQKYYAIEKVPTVLEYYSYLLHFQTLMAGPMVFYRDYMDFITGQNFLKHSVSCNGSNTNNRHAVMEPSPFYPALKKIIISVGCAAVFTSVMFPIEYAREEEFLKKGVMYQMYYLYVSTFLCRFKYYHAWLLADAINNISGLGFNGFTPEGKQKWDLISNVNIMGFELGQSLRDCIQSWNIVTNSWLRAVVYDRVPKKHGVMLTFALSALWHGFYPGYYLTFATGALYTVATRVARKYLRPQFLATPAKKQLYDFGCILFTRVLLTYMTFPFMLLDFWTSMRIYWNMYFWLHFLGAATILLLPRFLGQSEELLRNRLSKLVTNSNGVNSLQG